MANNPSGSIEIVTEKYEITFLKGEFTIYDRVKLRSFVATESDFYLLGKYIKAISDLVKELKL